jgi:hypothetical protein
MLTIATTYPYYGKTQCNNAPEYNLKKEWVFFFSLHPKLQILCRNFAYKQQASKQTSSVKPSPDYQSPELRKPLFVVDRGF